jgi:serine/threonine kinase 16
LIIFSSGFSYVDLVEDGRTHEEFALKRITCHGTDDQRIAMNEVESHRLLSDPGILEVIDYDLHGKTDPLGNGNSTSELLILLPYHRVCQLSRNQ